MDLVVRHLDNGVDKIYQYHEIETLPSEMISTSKQRDIVFVTGNKNKVAELLEHLKPKHARISVLNFDLIEVQNSSILNIVQQKCIRAFEEVNRDNEVDEDQVKPVLIEDTSLHFNALNGMPGPYIKWFMDAVGPAGLHKMLAGFDDKTADAVCLYGFMENRRRITFCRGTVRGRITEPRGNSWGWDPIFEEDRSGLTFAEMGPSVKSNFSHRSNAITILKKYLATVKRL